MSGRSWTLSCMPQFKCTCRSLCTSQFNHLRLLFNFGWHSRTLMRRRSPQQRYIWFGVSTTFRWKIQLGPGTPKRVRMFKLPLSGLGDDNRGWTESHCLHVFLLVLNIIQLFHFTKSKVSCDERGSNMWPSYLHSDALATRRFSEHVVCDN